jgi:hypothetical protein
MPAAIAGAVFELDGTILVRADAGLVMVAGITVTSERKSAPIVTLLTRLFLNT